MPGLISLLLLVLAIVALLAVFNWSIALPIVFAGMKTQALPVGLWIGLSISAGFCTSLLLQFLNYLQSRSLTTRVSQGREEPIRYRQQTSARRQKQNYTPPADENSNNDDESDWETASDNEEDWDFEEEDETPSDRAASPEENRTASSKESFTDYEVRQTPTSSNNSGSSYSYSYRQPEDSSVGKTESVYDVNYRVINSPYGQSDRQEPVEENDDEDWGFEDDELEDFEGDRGRDRR
ncbi:MAG: hypothetical protein KME17_28680 [Cyanosarcina radialis HA8281-LM2]|jgi:hypothetical protein|nr:hypothetical protein [Cyanosarcina radialis HA8281-LM2]